MVRILMHGCNGRMGKMITAIANEDESVQITAGVDVNTTAADGFPVFSSIGECDVDYDVIIDFTTASVVSDLLKFAKEHNKPVVLCTTGLSEDQLNEVTETSKSVPILRAANMSLGINVIEKIIRDTVKKLVPEGFDVEIVEKHHNQKLDAPSGTAIALADAMNDEMDGEFDYVYDRSGYRKKRERKELGISAVRGGSIVGEHEIIFAGTDEVITIKHTAYSRAVFAKGAIAAARFLAGKAPGMYDMSDVIAG